MESLQESYMQEKALEIAELVKEYRRNFHMHPELGFEEKWTSEKIALALEGLGFRVQRGVGKTGIVGEFGNGKPVVGIRADMDALPIEEANDLEFASQVPGVMHACGHDAHMAIALGVATILKDEKFPGTIRFLFQPSEEKEDEEGISGAPRMIEDGALENVDAILALHVNADAETGGIRMGSGMVYAGADFFEASIIGVGGHGGFPHEVIDPIHIAGHVILALNAIVSRRIRPYEPAVVSLGMIHGGSADNIIPERVEITGTIRYANENVQKQIHAEIERALSITKGFGGDFELKIEVGYPPTRNDPKIVELLLDVAEDIIGKERILEHKPEMGAEDFAFFTNLVPGAIFDLGCKIEGDVRRHHDPRFDVDERCLPIGVAVLAETALRLLRGGS
jgi:amidohydrolase